MAKRRRRKQNSNLPKWVLSAFAAAAVILSVITFGGDMIGIDTSFAQECMNFIDRILYGGSHLARANPAGLRRAEGLCH